MESKQEQTEANDFTVKCNACGLTYENWTGSTPCCGSIAFLVEDGQVTKKISLFASLSGEPIAPVTVNLRSKQ